MTRDQRAAGRKHGFVGTLSDEAGVGGIPFQYAGEWLDGGFNLSSFVLEWNTRVQWSEGDRTFEGLQGVFADSLPDSWGRTLMNEQFRRQGRNPELVALLERLAPGKTATDPARRPQPENMGSFGKS